jgi:hypothetical protein
MPASDVAGFLSGSKIDHPLWHTAKPEYLRDMMEHGVNMALNAHTSMGRGFYLSDVPLPRYGAPAQFALRTLNPLVLDYSSGWGAGSAQTMLGVEALRGHHSRSDAKLGFELMNRAQNDPETASYVRRGLLARGYDAIIGTNVEQPDGSPRQTYYVALRGDNVRGIAGSEQATTTSSSEPSLAAATAAASDAPARSSTA